MDITAIQMPGALSMDIFINACELNIISGVRQLKPSNNMKAK